MIAKIALSAALGLSVACMWLMWSNASLEAENVALRLQVGALEAKAANIKEDKDSDDEVDNIPDADLGNAPDRWMLEPGAGGVY